MSALVIERRGNLELRREPGGLRHYLQARTSKDMEPVRCGSSLELLMADGTWKRVRYECSLYADLVPSHDDVGHEAERGPVPQLYFTVPVAGRPKDTARSHYDDPDAWIYMPPWATLRWPEVRR